MFCQWRVWDNNTLQSDIHMSMHCKYISKLQPTRCNISWFIYFYRFCTCFRWFLHPSSGALNCTYSITYCQPILLLACSKQHYWLTISEAVCTVLCSWWWAEEPPETCRASVEINKSRNEQATILVDNTWSCMYSFVLLMMGGGTAWNM